MGEPLRDEDGERARVAAVLDQLRAGVRQRLAERATQSGPGDPQGRLLQLRQSEYVREPAPTSHRAGLGRWIVLARKVAHKLFGHWVVQPLLDQQNAFNQASAAAIQELLERQERLQAELREARAQLERLERRTPAGDPAGP